MYSKSGILDRPGILGKPWSSGQVFSDTAICPELWLFLEYKKVLRNPFPGA